jgi:hypothetical protein
LGGPELAFSTGLTDAYEEGIGALGILLTKTSFSTGLTDAPSEHALVQ